MVLPAPRRPGQPPERITLGAPYVSERGSLWVSGDNEGRVDRLRATFRITKLTRMERYDPKKLGFVVMVGELFGSRRHGAANHDVA